MENVLFIWIPKNAGTSIYDAMRPLGMRKLKFKEDYSRFNNKGMVTFGHVSIPYLLEQEYISSKFMHEATSFAFVRNPWDRFVSLFLYFKKHRIIIPESMTFEQFAEHVRKESIPPVSWYNRQGLSQCNNQVDWIFTTKMPLVDFIGRVENLQEDFNRVTDYLGTDRISLPFSNHIEQDRTQFYNDRLVNMIGEIYKRDVDHFKFTYNGV